MPINEELAVGKDVLSSVSTPGAMVSDAVVDGNFKGNIHFELLRPGGSRWLPVFTCTSNKSTPLNTPDSALTYRFRATITEGAANVYFGP